MDINWDYRPTPMILEPRADRLEAWATYIPEMRRQILSAQVTGILWMIASATWLKGRVPVSAAGAQMI
jgi:hypothetical protein